MFYGVEVWRVGWQRQQSVAVFFEFSFNIGLVVEGRVVDDDERVWSQFGNEALREPAGNELMMAASGEGDRGEPFLASLRHDEVGAPLFMIARHLAMHLDATLRPAMGAVALRLKAALIHVNDILRAMFGDPFT